MPIRSLAFLAILVLSGARASSALAEPDGGAASEPTPRDEPEVVAEPREPVRATSSSSKPMIPEWESPRATLTTFFARADAGRFDQAAEALELRGETDGSELARMLAAVLERSRTIDVDAISDAQDGDLDDGLPRNLEEIGVIEANGEPIPVRLVRRSTTNGGRWAFTRTTVAAAPRWYAELDDVFLREHVPQSLHRPGPFGILRWQWIALAALLPLCALLGYLLEGVFRRVAGVFVRRTKTTLDDRMLPRFAAPLRVAFALLALDVAVSYGSLTRRAQESVDRVRHLIFLWCAALVMIRLFGALGEATLRSPWARANASSRSLVPIAMRAGNVLALVVAVLLSLSSLGYDVGGIVAGLGIGGVVVALAAQKTVENLLGAFALGLDQPMREGDVVSLDGKTGTIERIGLRSSRLRTADRTLVTIPNGRLADMTIESFTARDRFRFATNLGLVYGTTSAQLREIVARIRALLAEHPERAPDAPVVRLVGLAESSLQIEITGWFLAESFDGFADVRQDVLIAILEIVESAGTELAFPTRTLHVETVPPPPR